MANDTGIIAENGTYELLLPQTGGIYQITATGAPPASTTVTIETAANGSSDWAPAGKDATDAQIAVPSTKCIRTSADFKYRLVVAGGTWTSEETRFWWGLANG